MKIVRPVSEERRAQLRVELEAEKTRFDEAAVRAADVIRRDLSVTRWISDYPLESALLVIASGIILAKTLNEEGRLQNRDFRAI
jgi:hypothetical protein